MLGTLDDPTLELAARERVGRCAVAVDLDSYLVHGRLGTRVDLVPLLGDDRDLADLVEQPLGETVDLRRRCGATCENAEVHTNLDRRQVVIVHGESEFRRVHGGTTAYPAAGLR